MILITMNVHDEDNLNVPSVTMTFEYDKPDYDAVSCLEDAMSHRFEDDERFEHMGLPMGELVKLEVVEDSLRKTGQRV